VPLANRVDPFGRLFATPERGALMGNRGGRFHDCERRTAMGRPWASKRWICCRLSFNGRRRQVWGRGYTELFFADEISALAAGHRPCFECRREDAAAFAAAWGRATGGAAPRADEMDAALHAERLSADRGKPLHAMRGVNLPRGAMVAVDGEPFAVDDAGLRRWSFAGFGPAERPRPRGEAAVLTPPAIVAVLGAGYVPAWRLAGR